MIKPFQQRLPPAAAKTFVIDLVPPAKPANRRVIGFGIVLFGVDVLAGGGLGTLDLSAFLAVDEAVAAGTCDERRDAILFTAQNGCFTIVQLARADTLLDAGLLTIGRDYRINIAPEVGGEYRAFDGAALGLPKRRDLWPRV